MKKKNIFFLGSIFSKIKWKILNNCFFFCLPSHNENFGLSAVEALSSKKPVLITNKVNIYRIIERYNAGIVVNDNHKRIYIVIKKLLKLKKKTYKKISENALRCFKDNFHIKHFEKNIITYLKYNSKKDN